MASGVAMPILHVLATLLIAPYVALAIVLLAFGHATSQGSLWGFIDTLFLHVMWILPWGMLGFGAGILVLAGLGIKHSTRTLAAALLCALAIASPVILVVVSGSRLDEGAIIFLMPCIAAAIFGAWRVSEERRIQHGGAA
jgi:hypothetical protein